MKSRHTRSTDTVSIHVIEKKKEYALQDDVEKQENFLVFLRLMSKKGFYEILQYVHSKKNVQYNQVKKFAMENKIVDSNASITIILNGLTNAGLLARTIRNERPIRTNYAMTDVGVKLLKMLKEMEKFFLR